MTKHWLSGAAAVLCLVAFAQPGMAQDPIYQCRGNEPFWSLKTEGADAVMTRPGDPDPQETAFSGKGYTLPTSNGPAYVWRGMGEPGGLVAVIRREACRDTMSDADPFDHSVIVTVPGLEAVSGCCVALSVEPDLSQTELDPPGEAPEPAEEPDDWSRYIDEFLPAIRRCVVDGGVLVERVEKAWPMNKGLVGVRLRALNGKRHDCVVEQGGAAIEFVDTVADDADMLPGEGNPLFYPAREAKPGFGSRRSEEVTDQNGVFMGWLVWPAERKPRVGQPDDGTGIERGDEAASEPGAPMSTVPAAELVGDWRLEDIEGKGVVDSLNSPIRISKDGKISGHAGCNRFFGTAKFKDGTIKFGPIMSTKMACPEAMMNQESRFLSALAKIERWSVENGLLLLKDGADDALLRLAPAAN